MKAKKRYPNEIDHHKRRRVLALRVAGHSFAHIADAVGVSRARAYQIWLKVAPKKKVKR